MKRYLTALFLCMPMIIMAQWPVVLEHPPGWDLNDPHVGLGANGEALVAATVAQGNVVHVYSITTAGELEWSGSHAESSADYVYLLAVADDSLGGCLVLMQEQYVRPTRVQIQLKLIRFDHHGDFIYTALVADSSTTATYSEANSVQVIGEIACIALFQQDADTAGTRVQRVVIETGEALEEPRSRFLTTGYPGAAFVGADWIVAAGDSLYRFRAESGELLGAWIRTLLWSNFVIPFANDSILVVGGYSGNLIAIQSFDSTGLRFSLSFEDVVSWLQAMRHDNSIFISYVQGSQTFYRIYSATDGLSGEMPMTLSPMGGWGLQLAGGDSAVIAVWDRTTPNPATIFLQQIQDDGIRWEQGQAIGSIDIPSTPPLDACSGNAYGWICWKGDDANIHVQPGDSVGTTAIAAKPTVGAKEFMLRQAYPNPFNGTTQISFALDRSRVIRLAVFDLTGRMVKELAAGRFEPGAYRFQWTPRGSSGVYFVRLEAGTNNATQKLLFIK